MHPAAAARRLKQPKTSVATWTSPAFQRLYDMILSHGTEDYVDSKKKVTHYNFFDDPIDDGADGLFGLDEPLARLMSVFKAAAHHFGPERRVLLLPGPA